MPHGVPIIRSNPKSNNKLKHIEIVEMTDNISEDILFSSNIWHPSNILNPNNINNIPYLSDSITDSTIDTYE